MAIDPESADVLSLTMQSPTISNCQNCSGRPVRGAASSTETPTALHVFAATRSRPALDGTLPNQREDRNRMVCWNLFAAACRMECSRSQLAAGKLILQSGERPLVLLSAGYRRDTVLAMLPAPWRGSLDTTSLVDAAARDRRHHPFADEVRRLMRRAHAWPELRLLHQAGLSDKIRRTSTRAVTSRDRCSLRSAFTRCGCLPLRADSINERHETGARNLSVAPEQIHVEIFNGSESMTPGVRSDANSA